MQDDEALELAKAKEAGRRIIHDMPTLRAELWKADDEIKRLRVEIYALMEENDQWLQLASDRHKEIEKLRADLTYRDMVIANWAQRFAGYGHTAQFAKEIGEFSREHLDRLIKLEAKRLAHEAANSSPES